MVTVTEKAAKRIQKMISEAKIKSPPGGIRFGVKSGGCSGYQYFYELVKNEDYWDCIMLCRRIRIMVDRKSMVIMRDTVIDCSDNLLDSTFIFNNPNAKASCGCGTSFELK